MVFGMDNLTRRTLKPDTIVHGPEGAVLVLARWGRVTRLGRMWDDERDEHRSRSPRVERQQEVVVAISKEHLAIFGYCRDQSRRHRQPCAWKIS